MLSNDQYYVLSLIRKSMGKNVNPEVHYDCSEEVKRIIIDNGLILLVYNSLPEHLKDEFSANYYAELGLSFQQEYEGERILNAISAKGLKCIALKGWEMKQLYPDKHMRKMADIDILVSPYKYQELRILMSKLGYDSELKEETSWKHDNFTKDSVTVELHKRLTDDSGAIQRWEREMWKNTRQYKDNILKMAIEDYYVFHYLHLHKDFMNGKIGLRRIVDSWLLQQLTIDAQYIQEIFKELNMGLFHDRIQYLSQVTMGEAEIDANSEVMLQHAFKYGVFGNEKVYKAGRITSNSRKSLFLGKIASFLSAVFLPYGRMKAHFPALVGRPYLLPFFWIKRIIFHLRNHGFSEKQRLNYGDVDKELYSEMKRFFDAGGV